MQDKGEDEDKDKDKDEDEINSLLKTLQDKYNAIQNLIQNMKHKQVQEGGSFKSTFLTFIKQKSDEEKDFT